MEDSSSQWLDSFSSVPSSLGSKVSKQSKKMKDLNKYSIRIKYDDGDVENEVYPDPAISLVREKSARSIRNLKHETQPIVYPSKVTEPSRKITPRILLTKMTERNL